MPVPAQSVDAYLVALPDALRREASLVRDEINRRLPAGYQEGIQCGMIGWSVPHSIFPRGYHCDPRQPLPFAGLAGRRHGVSVGVMCLYADPEASERFAKARRATGESLDMGTCCVRLRTAKASTLAVLGDAVARVPVARHVARYQPMLERLDTWSSAADGEGAAGARDRATRPRAKSRAAAGSGGSKRAGTKPSGEANVARRGR